MPRGKGKANYKVDTLILVVEELLPNGAQSWAEVAALYQSRSGEMILRDHDDVKRYWIEKCCNKFKKPTGTPGDPKRDMILRCQRIQERIHNKSASAIMGVESEGDDGLSLDSDEEDEDDDDDDVEGEVAAVLGGELGVGGSRVGSGAATPTVAGDGGLVDGGLGVCSVEEVGIPRMPPLLTQQLAEGPFVGPQPVQTPQQLAFTPEENQQHGLVATRLAAVQPMVLPGVARFGVVGAGRAVQQQVMPPPANQAQQPSTSQPAAKKKVKKSAESSSSSLNEKTKNSLSEKRGSIVKSIDKLASCLTADEANSAAMASASASSGMMPMMLMMQMQHQQQQQQQMQLQYQQQQQMMQQAFMQSQMELQVKTMQGRMLRKLRKKERKRKKKAKRKRKAKSAEGGAEERSSSSSSSSSSSDDS